MPGRLIYADQSGADEPVSLWIHMEVDHRTSTVTLDPAVSMVLSRVRRWKQKRLIWGMMPSALSSSIALQKRNTRQLNTAELKRLHQSSVVFPIVLSAVPCSKC